MVADVTPSLLPKSYIRMVVNDVHHMFVIVKSCVLVRGQDVQMNIYSIASGQIRVYFTSLVLSLDEVYWFTIQPNGGQQKWI